jgi:hypothetical protein
VAYNIDIANYIVHSRKCVNTNVVDGKCPSELESMLVEVVIDGATHESILVHSSFQVSPSRSSWRMSMRGAWKDWNSGLSTFSFVRN